MTDKYRERYLRWYARKKAGLVKHTGAGRRHGVPRPIDSVTGIPIMRVRPKPGYEQAWQVEPCYWQR